MINNGLFQINDTITKTVNNLVQSICSYGTIIKLKYDSDFYEKNQLQIDKTIEVFQENNLVQIWIDNNKKEFGFLTNNRSNLCIFDKNFIPRVDAIVKFNQFYNCNENNLNIFTSNIIISKDLNFSKTYIVNKPACLYIKYLTYNYTFGCLFIPYTFESILNKLSENIYFDTSTILEIIKKHDIDIKISCLPIILAAHEMSVESHKDIEKELFIEYFSLPKIKSNNIENDSIAALIPYYNNAELTVKCLIALKKSNLKDLDIYTLNNNSNNYSVEIVKKYSKFSIDLPIPFNYSRINNIGFSKVMRDDYKYLLLLNNDVEVEENTLSTMMSYFVDEKIGAVGCKLLYPNGNIQFGGVGLHHNISANQHNWYHIDQPRDNMEGYLSSLTFEAQCLTAACMLIRFDLAKTLGLFDEYSYPIGFSDVDLSIRIRQAGYNLIYTGEVKAIHHESVSRGIGYPDDMEGILLQKKLENLTFEVC